jgi:hypothetical protein
VAVPSQIKIIYAERAVVRASGPRNLAGHELPRLIKHGRFPWIEQQTPAGVATAVEEGTMVPSQSPVQDLESVRAVVLVAAVGAAIFWKEVIRAVLALIVIAVGAGMYVLLQSVH